MLRDKIIFFSLSFDSCQKMAHTLAGVEGKFESLDFYRKRKKRAKIVFLYVQPFNNGEVGMDIQWENGRSRVARSRSDRIM